MNLLKCSFKIQSLLVVQSNSILNTFVSSYKQCVDKLPLSVTRRGQILEGVLRVLGDISSVLTRCQQKFQGVERVRLPESKLFKRCHF